MQAFLHSFHCLCYNRNNNYRRKDAYDKENSTLLDEQYCKKAAINKGIGMGQKLAFREMLSEINTLASENGNRLTVQQVETFFEKAQLSEEHLLLVFDYLLSQQVKVDGYYKSSILNTLEGDRTVEENSRGAEVLEENAWQVLRDDSFALYEEELEALNLFVSSEEEMELFKFTACGDESARVKLIEMNLKTVVDLAKEHMKKNLVLSDLIQEGNVGLMLSMDKLPREGNLEEYRALVKGEIHNTIEDHIKELDYFKYAEKQIEEKVKYLDSAIKNLEEELEKKISMDELSTYLEMPVTEIIDILRMAGDEIEVVEMNETSEEYEERHFKSQTHSANNHESECTHDLENHDYLDEH